ncbi:unnamed protein product [Rotaria sp. Silwood1]|nr:unnamed protein product [Rotaria sp. Silwood1]CAF4627069.1 unnamed protein product [Rotaria sp. Silwood1]
MDKILTLGIATILASDISLVESAEYSESTKYFINVFKLDDGDKPSIRVGYDTPEERDEHRELFETQWKEVVEYKKPISWTEKVATISFALMALALATTVIYGIVK